MNKLFDNIMEAHAAIRPQVRVTPLDRSNALSAMLDCDLWFKGEHVQPTGSFKIRGATNKMRTLGEAARATGVITASTGNHGQATARAGALAGVPVTVYVSDSATPVKMEAMRALGAKLVVVEGNPVKAEILARQHAAEQGKPFISPYNDPDVVAGQGTLGVELHEQAPDLDAVFASLGCGGLVGGLGAALMQLSPRTRIVGVSPRNSPAMVRALEAGRIIDVPEYPTLSEGSAGGVEPGSITFPLCQSVIDETVLVSEEEIAVAMRHIARAERWMVEGAAGVALAGLIQCAKAYRGKKVAVVLCGRNIALDVFLQAIGGAGEAAS